MIGTKSASNSSSKTMGATAAVKARAPLIESNFGRKAAPPTVAPGAGKAASRASAAPRAAKAFALSWARPKDRRSAAQTSAAFIARAVPESMESATLSARADGTLKVCPPTVTSSAAAPSASKSTSFEPLFPTGSTSKPLPKLSLIARDTLAVSRILSDSRVTRSIFDKTNCREWGVEADTRLIQASVSFDSEGCRWESARQSTMPARVAIQASASAVAESASASARTSMRSTASRRELAADPAKHRDGSGPNAPGNSAAASTSKRGRPGGAADERIHRKGGCELRDATADPLPPSGPPGCGSSSSWA
mmetsp:Transcript_53156/g.172884  ORF Transcript_53156/g.172884 Transcript_53156/m.172884 type:complete len:308 (+) Transcript_53156:354-1277(+)